SMKLICLADTPASIPSSSWLARRASRQLRSSSPNALVFVPAIYSPFQAGDRHCTKMSLQPLPRRLWRRYLTSNCGANSDRTNSRSQSFIQSSLSPEENYDNNYWYHGIFARSGRTLLASPLSPFATVSPLLRQ